MEGCPCCTAPVDHSDLQAAPLRELSADQLRYYALTAMFTWGGLDDFKHFLPRLLELAAVEGFQALDTESLYGRLAYSKFDTWPPTEQAAVRAFAITHWRASLADESADDPDAVLTGVMCLGEDLTPYLDVLREFPHYIQWFRAEHARGRRNAYLDETTIAAEQRFHNWLHTTIGPRRHET